MLGALPWRARLVAAPYHVHVCSYFGQVSTFAEVSSRSRCNIQCIVRMWNAHLTILSSACVMATNAQDFSTIVTLVVVAT